MDDELGSGYRPKIQTNIMTIAIETTVVMPNSSWANRDETRFMQVTCRFLNIKAAGCFVGMLSARYRQAGPKTTVPDCGDGDLNDYLNEYGIP
jgi:hypothetical protein